MNTTDEEIDKICSDKAEHLIPTGKAKASQTNQGRNHSSKNLSENMCDYIICRNVP